VQHEEWEPEDRERVVGPQVAILDVDVELFGEAMNLERRELAGAGLDVGEVVVRVVETATAGEDETAAWLSLREQRCREARLGERKTDADRARRRPPGSAPLLVSPVVLRMW